MHAAVFFVTTELFLKLFCRPVDQFAEQQDETISQFIHHCHMMEESPGQKSMKNVEPPLCCFDHLEWVNC